MASDLRSKFNKWIVIFVLLPAALLMGACDFFFWRQLQQSHARLLDDQVAVVGAAFEQSLRAESLRLKTMVNLPATESLITMAHRRAAAAGTDSDAKVEAAWATAIRSDMIVRSVLDNEIALLFRQTCEHQKNIASLYMTDGAGTMLAASEKTPTFYQYQNDWWPLLRATGDDRILSEGATASGTLGLILPRRTEQGSIAAVIREEVSLAALIAEIAVPTNVQDVSVLLIAQDARLISGASTSTVEAVAPSLADHINTSGSPIGWYQGFRYSGRTLDAGVYWARPIWIVAVHPEGRLSAAKYAPLAAALLISCAAIFGVFVFARNVGSRLFFEPMREAAEAGIWVLRHAGGKAASAAAGEATRGGGRAGRGVSGVSHRAAAHPWSKIEYKEDTVLHQELNQWLASTQQSVHGGSEQLSAVISHDLDLATEFQLAFMNRQPPAVPAVYTEGRLRLEFSNVYKPAITLGGDFFDLAEVGPDCAGVFIGDVMGHGTRSALLTATIRTLLSMHYQIGRNPAHLLKELNKSLCGILRVLPGPFFASACYFVADTTSRIGTYAIAGHPPPLHLHGSVGRVALLPRPTPRGAALGVIPDEDFGADSVRLVDGDAFVFYTDGAYESTDRQGEQFGMERLEKSLQTHIYEPPGSLLRKVLDDILKFTGDEPIADDICLVAVHVTTKPPAKT